MLRWVLFAILIVPITFNLAVADTYYVSNGGSDSDDGRSEAQAFRTLGHACDAVDSPGDVLLIMGGTWDENNNVPGWSQNGTLVPKHSGSFGNPIIFKAHPNYERPVFKGSTSQPYRYAIAVCGVDFIVLDSLIATGGLRGIHLQSANFVTARNCVSHHSRSPSGDNGGGFFIGYTDPVYACSVYACTIYSNWDMVGNDGAGNVSGIHCYRNTKSVFQDNIIWDHTNGGNGIWLKLKNDSCIIRRNIIFDGSNGIKISSDCNYNEVYDNVLYNLNSQCIEMHSYNRYDRTTHNSVFNNTIYAVNAQSGINIGLNLEPDHGPLADISIWNNIVAYVPGDRDNLHVTNHNHQNLWFDYNCYWNPSGDLDVVEWKDTDYTLSEFQASRNLDLHSVSVDPEFVSAAGHDFRLSDSLSEVATGGRGSFYTPVSGGFNRSYMGAEVPLGYPGDPPVEDEDEESPAAIFDLGLTETSSNLAVGMVPTVSSTYAGFNPAVITDGTIDPNGESVTTWASTESSSSPHWIEFDFGSTRSIGRVTIFWAWNSYSSTWTTSQQYYIQRWNGSSYVDIGVVNNPAIGENTTTDFPAVETTRIRIYQPTGMGPSSYSTVIWLTELEIYGN